MAMMDGKGNGNGSNSKQVARAQYTDARQQ